MIYVIQSEQERQRAMKALSGIDTKHLWRMSLKRVTRTRTVRQNRLLYLWATVIARETGNDVADVVAAVKRMFLPVRRVDVGAMSFAAESHTSTLDTVEFTKLLDQIHAWALTDLGISLPQPDEPGFEHLLASVDNEE